MARTIAIWIFGLLAAAIIGGFLGSDEAHFDPYTLPTAAPLHSLV